jgi:hypothetical protein
LPSSDGWGTLVTTHTNPRRLAMSDPSDVTRTVDTYLAMWNETDPGRRAEHIERVWIRDGRYVDPLLEAQGRVAISEMVAGLLARFPGHRFFRVRASILTTTSSASPGSWPARRAWSW